ncbi:hypothetical protein Lrub_1456 [Legionella rubrilucens]|uniref:Uncharacterized protein n=1 Tax=Legionella rubrilucens TaxID=458 RepID=A0A0W0XWB2_9GAMM|nr:hypothetical protein [Legionella rubrilucens]KTD49105.1 hypothetical protein Lrub_1456 [Legionella rubrilucens]
MPQPFIIYKSLHSGNSRKITVINGQPYYQSTGINSGNKDLWYPFIMIRGTKEVNIDELPPDYSRVMFSRAMHLLEANVLVKYEACYLIKEKNDILANELHEGRLPTKSALIMSSRLSGGDVFESEELQAYGLTESEIIKAHTPIEFDSQALATLTDVDEVNDWLINQGAMVLKKITCPKPNHFGPDNDFDVSEESHQKIISEINAYMNSRGTMEDDQAVLNLRSRMFRHSELTKNKMDEASYLLKHVQSTRNAKLLIKTVSNMMYTDCDLENTNKITHLLTTSRFKACLQTIHAILANESIRYNQDKNQPESCYDKAEFDFPTGASYPGKVS